MTKYVVPNDMVAHLWAHQSQDHAKSGNGNCSFRDRTLYSYGTAIARIVDSPRGPVGLISNHKYSITTSQHQSSARSALGYGDAIVMPQFTVPIIGEYYGDMESAHVTNLAYFHNQYKSEFKRLKRTNSLWQSVPEFLAPYIDTLKLYAETFALELPAIDVESDIREITEARAKRETPEAIAKREKSAEQRCERSRRDFREVRGIFGEDWREGWNKNSLFTEEDRAARREALAAVNEDRIGAWRAGGNIRLPYHLDTMLRVHGNEIQTSRGAVFPVDHGKKAFQLIARIRATGQEYQRNGHTIHLGHFPLDRIDAEGNVQAGCHFVKWSEIELCAQQLGLFETENTVSA